MWDEFHATAYLQALQPGEPIVQWEEILGDAGAVVYGEHFK